LLIGCYKAFRQHRFPLLIELCCTSDALEALVAAHSEDDLSLNVFCIRESWNKVLARIKQLSTQAAVAELFFKNEFGLSTFAEASANKAAVEVLESIILLGKQDAEKRNILDIADFDLAIPLHLAADNPDPATIKLLVRHHPQALLMTDSQYGDTPLAWAIEDNESPAVVALLCELTTARLATIALRTTLLLCIKHVHPDVPVTPTEPLYLRLANARLCKDVWSVILEFLKALRGEVSGEGSYVCDQLVMRLRQTLCTSNKELLCPYHC